MKNSCYWAELAIEGVDVSALAAFMSVPEEEIRKRFESEITELPQDFTNALNGLHGRGDLMWIRVRFSRMDGNMVNAFTRRAACFCRIEKAKESPASAAVEISSTAQLF